MPSFRFCLLTPLLLCLVLSPGLGLAQSETKAKADPPKEDKKEATVVATLDAKVDPADTIRLIETRLKELASVSGTEAEAAKRIAELYRKALSNLEAVRTQEAKSNAFAKTLETAPADLQRLRGEILALQAKAEEKPPTLPPGLSVNELEQEQAKAQAEEATLGASLSEMEKTLETWSQSPASLRQSIQDARKALEALGAESTAPAPEGETPAMKEARLMVQDTRQQALRAELLRLERELLSQGAREDLLRAERDKALLEQKAVQTRGRLLEAELNQRRLAEAARVQQEAEVATREAADRHPLVGELAAFNADLTAKIGVATGAVSALNAELTQTRDQAKRLEEEFRSTRQRMEISGLTEVMGQVLMDSRQQLPAEEELLRSARDREGRIAEASLSQIRFNEDLYRLRDLDNQVAERLNTLAPAEVTEELRAEVKAQLERRRELLTQAQKANQTYLRLLGDIDFAAQEQMRNLTAYREFLSQQLLWTRSAPPLNMDVLASIPSGLHWLFAPRHWRQVGEVLLHEVTQSVPFWLSLLPLAWLISRGGAIRRAILAAAEPLRRVQTDKFSHTLQALGLTGLLALGWPLALAVLGWRLADAPLGTPFSKAVGTSLIAIASGWLSLRFFGLLCMAGGVADRHFRWTGSMLRLIRTQFTWATVILVPLSFVVALLFAEPKASYGMGLQRFTLIADMLILAYFLVRLLHPRQGLLANHLASHPRGWLNRLRHLWYPGLLALPLALSLLALLGFVYTAAILFKSLVGQLWLILGLIVLQQTILRWLEITRRRLALQAALEQPLVGTEPAGAERGPSQVTERRIELANLDEQTRRLLNAVIFIGALLGLWAIWSEVLPALARLEGIGLWTYLGLVDGEEKLKTFSLASLAFILATLVMATIAVRNLPALLEILLLDRFSVSPGARYAIKTLTAYALIAVAALLVSDTLGISWGRVQWLVAALGVGIGFGLQEIVANFISGLIILFERPVRVGDVVTIGDTTGTVTKIRIRATTVRNWDRQELLVPNKQFITGQLLNWTLSDALNRIVIRLGVDYEADLGLAMRLMAEAVAEDPRVLTEPAPTFIFESFGDSALLLQARCFVSQYDDRGPVSSELQQSILRKFRDQGISLPFPQRDLHLKGSDPLEVRLVRSGEALAG